MPLEDQGLPRVRGLLPLEATLPRTGPREEIAGLPTLSTQGRRGHTGCKSLRLRMTRRSAVVLRGPPGAGKTTIGKKLVQSLLGIETDLIILDRGWGKGEYRFVGGSGRYADLRGHASAVLALELGWGEPEGEEFAGATRNPREWYDVLQSEGRDIVLVRLEASETNLVARVRSRASALGQDPSSAIGGILAYFGARHTAVTTLADVLAVREQVFDTTTDSPDLIVERVCHVLEIPVH